MLRKSFAVGICGRAIYQRLLWINRRFSHVYRRKAQLYRRLIANSGDSAMFTGIPPHPLARAAFRHAGSSRKYRAGHISAVIAVLPAPAPRSHPSTAPTKLPHSIKVNFPRQLFLLKASFQLQAKCFRIIYWQGGEYIVATKRF